MVRPRIFRERACLNVSLHPDQLEWLRRSGAKSLSAVIRELIDNRRCAENLAAEDKT